MLPVKDTEIVQQPLAVFMLDADKIRQRAARGGGNDSPWLAFEQLEVTAIFQIPDLSVDGGCGDIEPLGRAANGAFGDNSKEILEDTTVKIP
nr:hypothetical protein [Komagataeibacter medellinensis]